MLIAGPNLTVDRTIGISRFDAGYIHRTEPVEARIGGGGANAARTARSLGYDVRLVSFLPRADVDSVCEQLERSGIQIDSVPCNGNLRVATILREIVGRMTVLNEPGPSIEPGEWEAYARLVRDRLAHRELLLCSGSLPPGAPVDGYSRVARAARHAGSLAVIDCTGPSLEAAVECGEGLITPNLAEAESILFGYRPEPVESHEAAAERAQDAAVALLRSGAWRAVVTAGAAGAAFAEQGPRGQRGWVRAPSVAGRNPIGAGDAFAAGLSLRLEADASLADATRYAAAVAAAHVEAPDDRIRPDRVRDLAAVGPDGYESQARLDLRVGPEVPAESA